MLARPKIQAQGLTFILKSQLLKGRIIMLITYCKIKVSMTKILIDERNRYRKKINERFRILQYMFKPLKYHYHTPIILLQEDSCKT